MALSWQHFESEDRMPRLTGAFACVDSGMVGCSRDGAALLWSTGLSGCVGVVLCGLDTGGVVAHLNQSIQYGGRDLALALTTIVRFAREKAPWLKATDVLIYYGDPEVNRGHDHKLDGARIKELTACERVIDLRRDSEKTPWGEDFVYDPRKQVVYTVAPGLALSGVGLGEAEPLKPGRQEFPFAGPEERAKLTPGLGHKGWFLVD
jgi:hypothetical protein